MTWEKRELVLLRAIAAADEEGRDVERASDLLTTGLSEAEISAGLKALTQAEMIGGINATTFSQGFDMIGIVLFSDQRQARR